MEVNNTIDDKTEEEQEVAKTLCLHSCCAPNSTYMIQYLSNHFEICVYYYNPNIDEQSEYSKRSYEQQKLIEQLPTKYPVTFVEGAYDGTLFKEKVASYGHCQKGGARCVKCYEMRLRETARFAKEKGCEYFATTLTMSLDKDSEQINTLGERIGDDFGISYLASDFKTHYGEGMRLSDFYGLYRQAYCGCAYSKEDEVQ